MEPDISELTVEGYDLTVGVNVLGQYHRIVNFQVLIFAQVIFTLRSYCFPRY